MKAMEYEYLLRRVYHCERNYARGASADIYRCMENAHRDLATKSMYRTQDDRTYEYHKWFAKVRGHVLAALAGGLSQIHNRTNHDQIEAIQEMQKQLTHEFYDKVALDRIITEAGTIFYDNGLEMR